MMMMKMTLMMKIQITIQMANNSDADQNDDDADEKNDFNNFGDEKQMMKKILNKMVNLNQMTTLKMNKKKTKVSNSSCQRAVAMTNQNC